MSTIAALPPLWPQPIPIIGLTGEYASGKTLFGLTIDPTRTLVYDEEKSSESYVSLGFTRIDLFDEVAKIHKNGSNPQQVFEWWLAHVRALKSGQFRVIILDTVGTIESGLVDWVESHPEHFGKTRNQYQKSSALMWGDVKEHWKFVLAELASKCETFVFTSHMATVWKGGEPTLQRKPKGKETLKELASLYLHLERTPDAKKNTPAKPAAVVLKSRLANFKLDETTGEIVTIPTLPPRIPECTPFKIREYMVKPPDYEHLKETEKAPDMNALTEDERLQLQTERARAEAETERIRADRESRRGVGSGSAKPSTNGTATVSSTTTPTGTPDRTVSQTATAPSDSTEFRPLKGPSNSEKQRLAELRDLVWTSKGLTDPEHHAAERKAAWLEVLKPFGVESAGELPNKSIAVLIERLEKAQDPFTSGQFGPVAS